jgi:hypothetical protein
MCFNETYSKVQTLSGAFPAQNDLKEEDALLSLFFSFSLEYSTRKVSESRKKLDLNRTYELLIYAGSANLLVENTITIKRNIKTLYWTLGNINIRVC